MASETLSFDLYWNDRGASSGMLRTGAGMKELGAQAASSAKDVKTLTDKVDALKGRSAEARVGLKGSKEANTELDKLDVKMIKLGKKVANPNIDMEGKVRALADIAAVDLAMDKLGRKFARPSLLHRLSFGLLGSGGNATGSAAGAAAGGGAASRFGNLTGAFAALPTPVIIGGIAAALLALPFAAQAAAGGIIAAFGGALAGIAILGASKTKEVRHSFADLQKTANADLVKIGRPFVPVLTSIMRTAGNVLDSMTPVFKDAAKIMAGPFKLFGDTLVKAFGQPAVAQSIKDIAGAFGAILKALAPQLPGDIKDVATGITRIANTIKDNPRAFADLISFFFKATGFALSMIAALGQVANYIEKHFIPALHDIAVVFDGVRHEIAHAWDQAFENTIGTVIRFVHNVETQFNSLRHGIATAFDGVRHFIATIGHDIAGAFDSVRHVFADVGHTIANTFDRVRHFQGQFDAFGKDIQMVGHWITVAFDAIRHSGAVAFDFLRHLIAATWDRIWHDTASRLADLRHSIASTFDNIRHGIATAWDTIWRNMTSQARTGTGNLVSWFRGLPGRVLDALRGLGHSLYAFAHAALNEFWNGLKAVAGSVLSWVGNFVSNIWGKVKKFFGISSPSSLFYSAGKNLMLGLFHGIKDNAHHAVAAAQVVSRRVADAGAGVQRWAPLVLQALRMEGLSPRLLGNVLYQMQTESGGNPNAINLTDINAQMGDPSRGLMQTIMSTFQAYHWPGTSGNIYDPLANIAAALNYARHRYGPTLMSGGMGIGSGHGYAAGSWNVPFTGPAVIHKGEMVIPAVPAAAIRRAGGTQTVVLEFRGGSEGRLTAALLEVLRREIRIRGGNTQQVLGRN